jgi:hypothetical protein
MNKSALTLLYSALLGMSAATAAAQDLNSEITVSHEVVPEERAATRLRVLPTLNLPTVTPGKLSAATGVNSAELNPAIVTLEPADYANSLTRTPWRGYADLGYFPIYNLGASAGYRFIDTPELTLNAYMQFNGYRYTTTHPDVNYRHLGDVTLHQNTVLGAVNAAWRPKGTNGTLSASAYYSFKRYNIPLGSADTIITANRVNIDANWAARIGAVDYNVGAAYNLITTSGMPDALNQGRAKINAGATWHYNDLSAWGLDLSATILETSHQTKGVTHIAPFYAYNAEHFLARLGANIDLKNGNTAYDHSVYLTPNVSFVWQPSAHFNLWGKADGRLEENSMAALFEEQPYCFPTEFYGYSELLAFDAGITIGPWRGAAISVFGGYTTTEDWLTSAPRLGYLYAHDVSGFHYGVALNYDYRSFLSFNTRLEMAQAPDGDYDTGYCYWRDHARVNFTADATVRPISALSIKLGYHLRSSRSKPTEAGGIQSLRTISNLSLGAHYAITEQFGVFARGENLLNRHWYLGPAIPSQGITGLVGVTYKF